MVLTGNATFNNISVISWWSVLLEEEPDKKTNNRECHILPKEDQ